MNNKMSCFLIAVGYLLSMPQAFAGSEEEVDIQKEATKIVEASQLKSEGVEEFSDGLNQFLEPFNKMGSGLIKMGDGIWTMTKNGAIIAAKDAKNEIVQDYRAVKGSAYKLFLITQGGSEYVAIQVSGGMIFIGDNVQQTSDLISAGAGAVTSHAKLKILQSTLGANVLFDIIGEGLRAERNRATLRHYLDLRATRKFFKHSSRATFAVVDGIFSNTLSVCKVPFKKIGNGLSKVAEAIGNVTSAAYDNTTEFCSSMRDGSGALVDAVTYPFESDEDRRKNWVDYYGNSVEPVSDETLKAA
ncbi:MAG: hypothetical protein AAB116_22825, partial [Candidatus Poribacteria bacterium]